MHDCTVEVKEGDLINGKRLPFERDQVHGATVILCVIYYIQD